MNRSASPQVFIFLVSISLLGCSLSSKTVTIPQLRRTQHDLIRAHYEHTYSTYADRKTHLFQRITDTRLIPASILPHFDSIISHHYTYDLYISGYFKNSDRISQDTSLYLFIERYPKYVALTDSEKFSPLVRDHLSAIHTFCLEQDLPFSEYYVNTKTIRTDTNRLFISVYDDVAFRTMRDLPHTLGSPSENSGSLEIDIKNHCVVRKWNWQ